MQKIFLGLGSNINAEAHLRAGLTMLHACLGELRVSSVYQNNAVGFEGDPFWNMVVGVTSDIELEQLIKSIKFIEDANGRNRGEPKFGPRTLDIDVLTYGDLVGLHAGIWLPRSEITEQAYVLRPLAEIASNEPLPGKEQTYAQLWDGFDQLGQPMTRVAFNWRTPEAID